MTTAGQTFPDFPDFPDNSLTNLSISEFVILFLLLRSRLAKILPFGDNFFSSLQAITDISMHKIAENLRRNNRSMPHADFILLLNEHLRESEGFLRQFLQQSYSLWKILARLELDVQQQGDQARFLMQLNDHPIVRLILRQMLCRHGIGGQMTRWKKFFGRGTWSDEKLQLFFGNLKSYLKDQVASFFIPSTAEIQARIALLGLKVEALTDPDLGMPQLTDFDKQVEDEVRKCLNLVSAEKFLLELPPAGKKGIPPVA